MAARVGSVVVDMVANTAQFERGMKQAAATTSNTSKIITQTSWQQAQAALRAKSATDKYNASVRGSTVAMGSQVAAMSASLGVGSGLQGQLFMLANGYAMLRDRALQAAQAQKTQAAASGINAGKSPLMMMAGAALPMLGGVAAITGAMYAINKLTDAIKSQKEEVAKYKNVDTAAYERILSMPAERAAMMARLKEAAKTDDTVSIGDAMWIGGPEDWMKEKGRKFVALDTERIAKLIKEVTDNYNDAVSKIGKQPSMLDKLLEDVANPAYDSSDWRARLEEAVAERRKEIYAEIAKKEQKSVSDMEMSFGINMSDGSKMTALQKQLRSVAESYDAAIERANELTDATLKATSVKGLEKAREDALEAARKKHHSDEMDRIKKGMDATRKAVADRIQSLRDEQTKRAELMQRRSGVVLGGTTGAYELLANARSEAYASQRNSGDVVGPAINRGIDRVVGFLEKALPLIGGNKIEGNLKTAVDYLRILASKEAQTF